MTVKNAVKLWLCRLEPFSSAQSYQLYCGDCLHHWSPLKHNLGFVTITNSVKLWLCRPEPFSSAQLDILWRLFEPLFTTQTYCDNKKFGQTLAVSSNLLVQSAMLWRLFEPLFTTWFILGLWQYIKKLSRWLIYGKISQEITTYWLRVNLAIYLTNMVTLYYNMSDEHFWKHCF